jgi:hypothetical protein
MNSTLMLAAAPVLPKARTRLARKAVSSFIEAILLPAPLAPLAPYLSYGALM